MLLCTQELHASASGADAEGEEDDEETDSRQDLSTGVECADDRNAADDDDDVKVSRV